MEVACGGAGDEVCDGALDKGRVADYVDEVVAGAEVDGLFEEELYARAGGEGEGGEVVEACCDEDDEEGDGDVVGDAVEEGGEGQEEDGGEDGDDHVGHCRVSAVAAGLLECCGQEEGDLAGEDDLQRDREEELRDPGPGWEVFAPALFGPVDVLVFRWWDAGADVPEAGRGIDGAPEKGGCLGGRRVISVMRSSRGRSGV